jgi:hypothetical protein
MTETWTVATFADIGYYSRDLDIDDFGWHQLLWPKFGHRQLCPEAATMAGIRPTMGTKPLWGFFFFFFNKRELGGWYLLVEETMAVRHVILTKRDSHGCGKRNSFGTG